MNTGRSVPFFVGCCLLLVPAMCEARMGVEFWRSSTGVGYAPLLAVPG
jgi:hypothetical protein